MMINFGATKKNANTFSKYVWRRYFYNKLNDIIQDSSSGLFGTTSKIIGKLLIGISKPILRNPYGIEQKIVDIEKQIFLWENSTEVIEPITYFNRSGDGYGLIFKTVAELNNGSTQFIKTMSVLGQKLGALITMRDSIQDRKIDTKTGNYNPFHSWKNTDMIKYYQKHRTILAKEIEVLAKISQKSTIKVPNTTNVFKGLSVYAQTTANPYRRCNKQLQANAKKCLQTNQPMVNNIVDPNQQPQQEGKAEEDTCYIDCCASDCEGCCHIPNNPCSSCCEGCDCCIDCCHNCSGGLSGCA